MNRLCGLSRLDSLEASSKNYAVEQTQKALSKTSAEEAMPQARMKQETASQVEVLEMKALCNKRTWYLSNPSFVGRP